METPTRQRNRARRDEFAVICAELFSRGDTDPSSPAVRLFKTSQLNAQRNNANKGDNANNIAELYCK